MNRQDEERVTALERQVKRITDAQAAQFTTVLQRFTAIDTRLASMNDTLQMVARLIYKKFGDNPDNSHERFGV